MPYKSHLRLLAELILRSIHAIESRLDNEGLEFPRLADPFDATDKAEKVLLEDEMLAATSQIVAAASQLIAMVRSPVQTIMEDSLLFHLPSCMRAAVESNMVEIIRESGAQGIHANDIAKINNTDPVKAGTREYFGSSPTTIYLPRLGLMCSPPIDFRLFLIPESRWLTYNKSACPLPNEAHYKSNTSCGSPNCRHVNTSGIGALMLMHADEAFKGSAYLTEAFTDPATAHSVKSTDSAWNIATKTDAFLFDWYDQPENEHLKTRFSFAMACSIKLEPPESILVGFKWADLPENSIVVDVGGGVGSTALIIAKAVPHLNLVVQDRSSVIEDAKIYWAEAAPHLLESGRVKLRVHNFFAAQPLENAAVFLLRWIMHDWPDPSAIQILRHLRDAATPETKLVTVDIILPYTCSDTSVTNRIPGAGRPPAPAPLLANMGAVNNMKYWLDFQMFVLGNCQERTLGHFVDLAAQSGWTVKEVHHIPGSSLGQYISVPS
ncbi:O-methyltransferase [Mycena sanguinolenta]|uniref:O-methyltransferase n=1 Tax=Mycena sanguinolenta TaxID=230812 RepID=A0A8H7DD87_9AGAR|nr:O-methyltransferase [Mycena sanguinolenta]